MAAFLDRVPQRGGCPACVDGCAPLVATRHAHRRNTPHALGCTPADIHAAPCLLFACETSVCSQMQNVRIFELSA